MNSNETGRQPEQQGQDASQSQPEQQHQQRHHDPRGREGGGSGLASQSPKGGASQDGFGQGGGEGAPDQSEHNARPGQA